MKIDSDYRLKGDSILDDPVITSSNCHVPCFCGFCEPGEYYQCAGCLRGCAYCFGAADDYFDYCDDCAHELSSNSITVVIQVKRPNIYTNC